METEQKTIPQRLTVSTHVVSSVIEKGNTSGRHSTHLFYITSGLGSTFPKRESGTSYCASATISVPLICDVAHGYKTQKPS
jgi:hypothetical protein